MLIIWASNMVRFQNRNDLIDYVAKHSNDYTIRRSVIEGKVELLGGFSCIPPSTEGGWILCVTSIHDRHWNVAIVVDKKRPLVFTISDPPWKLWCGDLSTHELMRGDYPETYAQIRDSYIGAKK